MMSDNNESSESLLLLSKAPFGLEGASDAKPDHDKTNSEDQHDIEDQEENPRAEIFNQILNARLEENSDAYTFEDLDLEDSDIKQIAKLKSVIKNFPDPGNDLPVEGQYRDFVPEIYINLSGNSLRLLTPSLFDVQNITTLILPDNHIEELPAQISKLCNLHELNIAKNELTWLPFDFLKLMQENSAGSLDIMSSNGNTWLMPKDTQILRDAHIISLHQALQGTLKLSNTPLDLGTLHEMNEVHDAFASKLNKEEYIWYLSICDMEVDFLNNLDPSVSPPNQVPGFFPHHSPFTRSGVYDTREPMYIARTPVSYFDQVGRLEKDSPISPSSTVYDDFAVITATARGAHGVPSSWYTPPSSGSITSLATTAFKVALDLARDLGQEKDLTAWFKEYRSLLPFTEEMLKQADSNDCGGYGKFKKCHVCEKDYIVVRAEWIEWWLTHAAEPLPFKVQVCSWRCVPDAMVHRPSIVFSW